MRRNFISCTFLLMSVTSLSGFAAGQGGKFNVYSPVPRHLRPGLDVRLKLYVELERTGQFEKLYEIFSDSYVAHLKTFNRGGMSEYVPFEKGLGKSRMEVVDFTPTSTKRVVGGVYVIFGRIKSRWGERFHEDKGSIEARRQNGEWYFSELGIEVVD
jgi:hypothetical protein